MLVCAPALLLESDVLSTTGFVDSLALCQYVPLHCCWSRMDSRQLALLIVKQGPSFLDLGLNANKFWMI